MYSTLKGKPQPHSTTSEWVYVQGHRGSTKYSRNPSGNLNLCNQPTSFPFQYFATSERVWRNPNPSAPSFTETRTPLYFIYVRCGGRSFLQSCSPAVFHRDTESWFLNQCMVWSPIWTLKSMNYNKKYSWSSDEDKISYSPVAFSVK